jgi:hypothetical protein
MTQQVRAGVAHDFQTVFIFDGDDGQLRIRFDQIAGVNQLAVDAAGDTGFRQARADIARDIHRGNGVVEMTLTSVRKGNNRH